MVTSNTFTTYIRQSPFLYNTILLSPLLFLGAVIIFLLQRADTLRQGAGLIQPVAPPPVSVEADILPDDEYDEFDDGEDVDQIDDGDVYNEADDDDITQFLNEAAGGDIGGQGENDENNDPNARVGPGPENNPRAQTFLPPPRNIGKKKARSLEQRDRRRAYHEFLQSQALERRAQQTTIEEEENERTFAEKQRRALAEIKIEQKRAKEREEQRVQEELDAKAVADLKKFVLEKMGVGKIAVKEVGKKVGKAEGWVRRVLREEKLLGLVEGVDEKGAVVLMITEEGMLVKIGEKEVHILQEELEKKGEMNWKEISLLLETQLSRKF